MKRFFPNTWQEHLIFIAIFGILTFSIFIRAIDTGSLWQWAITIILFVITLKQIYRAIYTFIKK